MYKTREELIEEGPVRQLNYVRDSVECWKNTEPTGELLNNAISYLSDQQSNIEKKWLNKPNPEAYQQTYDKIATYLSILRDAETGKSVEASRVHQAMKQVEEKIIGLSKNWEEDPLDQCIPPVLENYLYIRSLLEKIYFNELGR